jgi:hypothetical protein
VLHRGFLQELCQVFDGAAHENLHGVSTVR